MIDENLQVELRKRFNPDGSPLRQQQLRMLEILKYIDKVCKENNIQYWLSSGTLLGAVRHGGFIPWDDDLDIEMLREDYIKFVKVFPNSENFALQVHETDPFYYWPFAKIRDNKSKISEIGTVRHYKYNGLYVDVFCLEKAPKLPCRLYGGLMFHMGSFANVHAENKFIVQSLELARKLVMGSIWAFRPILKLFSQKELRHTYGSGFLAPRVYDEIFPLTNISFEGYKFPAPKDCHNYLGRMYRDYSSLPDLNKLHTHLVKCEIY